MKTHILIAVGLLGLLAPQCWANDEPRQAASARKILETWRSSNAQPAERFLHVVCWTPSDREFPTGYRDRLSRMLLHIQNFYAEEMDRNGFGKRSFRLKLDPDGRVALHEVRGTHPTAHYETKSGAEIRDECRPVLRQAGLDISQETIALFCNLATWDEKGLRFSHKSPYYAGGTYRSGTAWQLDSPELDSLNLDKKRPMIQDGQYGRISLGKHNSIFIGGMAHELGHAFGLPHCKERPDQRKRGTALMGSGNRTYGDELRGEGKGTFLTFAHALRLASHPLFSGQVETRTNRPESTLADLKIQVDGKALTVAGKLTGTPDLYGVVAYFDPEGHDDYDQTSMTAIPVEDGRFELRSDALSPGKGALKLVPLHANGAVGGGRGVARARYPYQVAEDGTPNLGSIQTRLLLEPVIKALSQGDAASARRLASDLKDKDKEAATIASALTEPAQPTHTPADYQGNAATQSLTAFKADAASVGWLRPTFNRIPDPSMLLESAGELFATGIYAHAPSRHQYALGARWDSFQGKVGIATGYTGSVRFLIKGDGQDLWQSPTIRPDQLVPFNVSVKGIKHLELVTSPTDDGTSSDWGLWLNPQLTRTHK